MGDRLACCLWKCLSSECFQQIIRGLQLDDKSSSEVSENMKIKSDNISTATFTVCRVGEVNHVQQSVLTV